MSNVQATSPLNLRPRAVRALMAMFGLASASQITPEHVRIARRGYVDAIQRGWVRSSPRSLQCRMVDCAFLDDGRVYDAYVLDAGKDADTARVLVFTPDGPVKERVHHSRLRLKDSRRAA